ncbi:MAG: Bug family tripartite tricarboxylate transporter substrate binding protein [Alphaproteobacteria bacterium]
MTRITPAIRPLLAAASIAAVTAAVHPAQAQSVAEFYKGRQITVIASTGVGGDYDLAARTIARHMGKYIPGNPSFVVQNMPGAGHVLATNHLYNQAPKDGSVIGTVGNSIVLHQVLDGKGVRYDASKFNWLGTTGISNLMTVVWHTTGVKTAEDLRKTEVISGGTGAGSGSVLYTTVARNLLGLRFKNVLGYERARDIDLAMERGEVQARSGFSYGSLAGEHPDWIKDGKVVFVFQVGETRAPELPNVPLMTELARNDEERRILRMISSPVGIGRPYLTTPDVPADRVAALRQAFDATVKDAGFLADVKKQDFDLYPNTGANVAAIVKETVEASPDLIAKAKAAMQPKEPETQKK